MENIIKSLRSCNNSDARILIIKEYLSKGFDINSVDNNGNTFLMHACMIKDIEMVKFLLKNNADCGIKNNLGVRPGKFVREQIRSAKKKVLARKDSGLNTFNEIKSLSDDIIAYENISSLLTNSAELTR